MKTYTVNAVRWPLGWELHIEGVGVTQAKNLAEAEDVARDFIGVDENSFEVAITPQLDDELAAAVRSAREGVEEFERARTEAKLRSRHAARVLKDRGIRGVDIARVMGISEQRVSQLLKADASVDV